MLPADSNAPGGAPGADDPHPIAQLGITGAELESSLTRRVDWQQLVGALPHLVWVARPDGYHEYFNQQWFDYTGLTLAESLGDGWNPPFHPDERPLARRLWDEATLTGEPYEIEYRLRRHDGVYRWMLGRAVPLRDESGTLLKWFGTCTDIEELKVALDDAAELRHELERRATRDSLTGLANRELLFEQMEHKLSQRRRTGMAVVYMDLDWFKEINDRLGHSAGDRLLAFIGERLRDTVRQGDIAARIGGDEFVVVGEAQDHEEAERFAQRVVEGVRGRLSVSGESVEVAASVGVTYVDAADTRSADTVLAHADARMYEEKRRR
ncbi:sensor domain-containing diguanylate cyclase [Demequina sp. SO4-18]|uniref:sensor domain-containing diguanylate cyclase n=1 Tax=Demequina sp. SO4-18 TaxID=3401026 RepID=UPI003B59AE46